MSNVTLQAYSVQQQSWHNSNIPPSRCTKVVSKCLYSPSHRDAGGWAPGKGEGASGQAPSSHTLRSTTARKPNPDAGKESILRSLDLGLGGAWCCQCFVDGLCWPGTSYTNRAAAGLLQVCSEIAWPPPVLVHCPVGGLHAVHHRVVVQRQKLSKEEGGAPVHACQPWHCLAVPY
uniref:Uncharacterized protein n=1 Tax=Eutreptiella gymnastica TaxID=73025 RepID=A0A6T2B6B9_9EUGL